MAINVHSNNTNTDNNLRSDSNSNSNSTNSDNNGSPITLMLVGNKLDLVNLRQVDKEEVEIYCKEKGYEYIETSALDGENVESAFRNTLTTIYSRLCNNNGLNNGSNHNQNFLIDIKDAHNQHNRVNCCG